MIRASIVIPTFNRADIVVRAVQAVLNQDFHDFELIIVNDGGTDHTSEAIRAIDDSRVRYLERSNGGISAARNTGLNSAQGEWITFLDDDDQPLTGWLSTFEQLMSAPQTGIACVGAVQKRGGSPDKVVLPHRLKPVYQSEFGLFMAGTFACRTDLLREAGGFAEGLTCSHATELAMRLIPACHRRSLLLKSSDKVLIQINRENPLNRPMSSPECLLNGVTYILQTHRELLKQSPDSISRYLSIAGVAAARLGRYGESRKFFFDSIRTDPWKIRPYLRFFISLNRRLADYVWRYANFGADAPESYA